jgi:3-oxoacyl-[acyl-carrier protein] reductase
MNNNKTVIITGGARGIGSALSEAFAGAAWSVAVNYHTSAEQAEALCRKITELGGTAKLFQTDVSDSNAAHKMIESVLNEQGRIDTLINNAGICHNSSLSRMSEEEWDPVIATDLKGPWNMIRACAPAMISQNSGSIINIGSIGGIKGLAGGSNYAAAKGALIELTKQTAIELGKNGISVNTVLPGFHLSGMGAHATENYTKQSREDSVLKTTTNITELAQFIVMLASTKTVSGQTFNWDSRII